MALVDSGEMNPSQSFTDAQEETPTLYEPDVLIHDGKTMRLRCRLLKGFF